MSYSLNKDGAKQANVKFGGNIDKNGDYTLKIERAVWVSGQAPKQSRGLSIHFIDADKNKAKIDLWFQKADGGRNDMSANMLDGIMTCLGLQNLTEKPMQIEEYDNKAGHDVTKDVVACPELAGKPLGVLIQIETDAYVKDGETKTIDKPTIYAVYQYKTNLTPSEILSGTTVANEVKKLNTLLEAAKPHFTKDYRNLMNGSNQQSGGYGAPAVNSPAAAADLDDDLPF